MQKRERDALIDFGNYPEICADGIGDVFAVGQIAHVILFRWRKIDGVVRRCIAGEVVRPVAEAPDEFLRWRAVFRWPELALLH